MKKQFYLAILLAVLFLVLLITGLIMQFHLLTVPTQKLLNKNIHIYVSYLTTALIILHLAWNSSWLKTAKRRVFGEKD